LINELKKYKYWRYKSKQMQAKNNSGKQFMTKLEDVVGENQRMHKLNDMNLLYKVQETLLTKEKLIPQNVRNLFEIRKTLKGK
jgi:hypothetical protein